MTFRDTARRNAAAVRVNRIPHMDARMDLGSQGEGGATSATEMLRGMSGVLRRFHSQSMA